MYLEQLCAATSTNKLKDARSPWTKIMEIASGSPSHTMRRIDCFSIPYGKRINMGIYTYNVDTYNRLRELKDQLEAEFDENLNWEYLKPTDTTRSIIIEEKADVFNPEEQSKIFDGIINHFDRITTALSMAGERLNLSGDSSETRFGIRKRYWTYTLVQIHEIHGNPGSFSNVNPSTDNWINEMIP